MRYKPTPWRSYESHHALKFDAIESGVIRRVGVEQRSSTRSIDARRCQSRRVSPSPASPIGLKIAHIALMTQARRSSRSPFPALNFPEPRQNDIPSRWITSEWSTIQELSAFGLCNGVTQDLTICESCNHARFLGRGLRESQKSHFGARPFYAQVAPRTRRRLHRRNPIRMPPIT